MHIKIFEKHLSNLFGENRLLKMFALTMVFVSIANHILLQRVMNSQRTILVPASLNTRVQILGDRASDEYIKSFAQLAGGYAFTYTPMNVQQNFAELLAMFAPEVYEQTRKTLTDLATTVVNAKVSQVFYTQSITIDSQQGTIEVKGQEVRWVEGAQLDSVFKAYILGYRMENSRFFLVSLHESGVDPNGLEKTRVEIDRDKALFMAVEKPSSVQVTGGR